VNAEDDVRVEQLEQSLEVAGAPGLEEGIDDSALLDRVGVLRRR
jgi:LPS O-antigen subunit length determinant protein (WzzB/FepE family)